MNGIETERLTVEFKAGIRAVDRLDIAVRPGEIYGFLGPNGAGKSTTVSVLTTLLRPTAGRATVAGLDVVADAGRVRGLIGAALQEVALDDRLTPNEHVRLQAALHGLDRGGSRRRAKTLLDRVGLTGAADRKVGTFSGGMRRRLDLALALVHRPSILFLDEPTTGLDLQSRSALWDEVRRLAADGMTVFLTTQYLEEADALADRVAVIDGGVLVAEGTPAALKAEIARPSVEVTPASESDGPAIAATLRRFGEPAAGRPGTLTFRLDDPDPALADVVRALDEAGLPVARLDLRAPTLDDVFLVKTGHRLEGRRLEAAPEANSVAGAVR